MATTALIMSWGMPIEGRESKAIEVFFAAMQYWEQLRQSKKIEAYRNYGPLTGNFGTCAGMLIVEGTDEQIDAVQKSEEFRQIFNRVTIIGHNVTLELAETGDRITARMQRYGQQFKQTVG